MLVIITLVFFSFFLLLNGTLTWPVDKYFWRCSIISWGISSAQGTLPNMSGGVVFHGLFFCLGLSQQLFWRILDSIYGFITAISGDVASRISCRPNLDVINSYFVCLPRLYCNDKTHYYYHSNFFVNYTILWPGKGRVYKSAMVVSDSLCISICQIVFFLILEVKCNATLIKLLLLGVSQMVFVVAL